MRVVVQKKQIGIAAVSLLLLGLIVAAVLYFVPLFKVQNVQVEGNAVMAAEDVTAAAAVQTGENLLRVDLESVARRVNELPWVAVTHVDRSLPDTLRVRVEEHRAVMFSTRSDGAHLFDANGRAFVIDTPPAGSIEISGISADEDPAYAELGSVVMQIDEAVRQQVRSIKVDSANSFTFVLHDEREVYFGSTENLQDKLITLHAALSRPERHLDISGAPIIAVRN